MDGSTRGGPGNFGEPSDDPNALYALGSSSGEMLRLQRQADELASQSAELLDHVGLQPGNHVIDLGCGPLGVLGLLSQRVSPGGRVVGLDANPAHLAMAREFAQSRQLELELVCADARQTGLPPASFDLVHARALLITVPKPEEMVAEMVRLARPGGWVVGLEPDNGAALYYPPDPAFDRLSEIFRAVFSRNGADPHIGRRLASLYREAGLREVTVEARAELYPPGHSRRTVRADLIQAMRPQILKLGVAETDELDELDARVRAHLADPNTLALPHLTFLVWGRAALD